ncbi:MAG: ATP-grasp domain-containing protein [Terriglobales bacterium]
MSILVTDGNQRSTLAVVRALGKAGVAVTVAESQTRSLAGVSRYCGGRLLHPSPEQDSPGFVEFVRGVLANERYDTLIPMTDVSLQLTALAGQETASRVRLPIPSARAVERALDKRAMLMLAEQMGLACPRTCALSQAADLEDLARRLEYPVVIKPRFSKYRCGNRWISEGVHYAGTPAELIGHYQRVHSMVPDPLVQECIQGEGRGVFLLLWEGELKAAFCHRRLREKPPWGGVSVCRESIALDQALVERSVALLRALEWQGVAMVEYKMDERDGLPKFMELNGRFWGSLQLATDAGLNFPLLLHRLSMGEKPEPQFGYKTGVKSRWLLGDLDHLWLSLRHRNKWPTGARPVQSRWRVCMDFLKFLEPDLHYEVFRLDDPAPGCLESAAYVAGLFRSAKRRQEKLGGAGAY